MDKLTKRFDDIIKTFKNKNHELLNTSQNKFDRDYVEFTVDISKLDVELQNFIDNNFTYIFENVYLLSNYLFIFLIGASETLSTP